MNGIGSPRSVRRFIPLADAVTILAAELSNVREARELLIERAQIGDLSAMAARAHGPYEDRNLDEVDWPVPAELWLRLDRHSESEWRRGDLTAAVEPNRYAELDEDSNKPLRMIGVKFDLEEVTRLAESLPVEWIDASGAIELLLPMYSFATAAARALCKRGRHGLVKTRARLFKWQVNATGDYYGVRKVDRQAEFACLPETFWWAEGGEALKQNWITGDFSTWKDSEFRLQAFGVEFARRNVEAMLPSLSSTAAELSDGAAHDSPLTVEVFAELPTGDPGRPSKGYELYWAEFERRSRKGTCADSLAGEATALQVWFKQAYPTAAVPTVKTISNRIRDTYNARKTRP